MSTCGVQQRKPHEGNIHNIISWIWHGLNTFWTHGHREALLLAICVKHYTGIDVQPHKTILVLNSDISKRKHLKRIR